MSTLLSLHHYWQSIWDKQNDDVFVSLASTPRNYAYIQWWSLNPYLSSGLCNNPEWDLLRVTISTALAKLALFNRVSLPQHYWCFEWDTPLLRRTISRTEKSVMASLASNHQIDAGSNASLLVTVKNVSRHYQIFLGGGGTMTPSWATELIQTPHLQIRQLQPGWLPQRALGELQEGRDPLDGFFSLTFPPSPPKTQIQEGDIRHVAGCRAPSIQWWACGHATCADLFSQQMFSEHLPHAKTFSSHLG